MKLKKFFKNLRKKIRKILPEPLEELFEEAEDFFEDLFENIFVKRKFKFKKLKKIKLYGTIVAVRPAFLFAERIESLLKILFGFSILISGIIASFWGFTRLSDLMTALITSFVGRIIIIIGFSYFLLGIWKLSKIKI